MPSPWPIRPSGAPRASGNCTRCRHSTIRRARVMTTPASISAGSITVGPFQQGAVDLGRPPAALARTEHQPPVTVGGDAQRGRRPAEVVVGQRPPLAAAGRGEQRRQPGNRLRTIGRQRQRVDLPHPVGIGVPQDGERGHARGPPALLGHAHPGTRRSPPRLVASAGHRTAAAKGCVAGAFFSGRNFVQSARVTATALAHSARPGTVGPSQWPPGARAPAAGLWSTPSPRGAWARPPRLAAATSPSGSLAAAPGRARSSTGPATPPPAVRRFSGARSTSIAIRQRPAGSGSDAAAATGPAPSRRSNCSPNPSHTPAHRANRRRWPDATDRPTPARPAGRRARRSGVVLAQPPARPAQRRPADQQHRQRARRPGDRRGPARWQAARAHDRRHARAPAPPPPPPPAGTSARRWAGGSGPRRSTARTRPASAAWIGHERQRRPAPPRQTPRRCRRRTPPPAPTRTRRSAAPGRGGGDRRRSRAGPGGSTPWRYSGQYSSDRSWASSRSALVTTRPGGVGRRERGPLAGPAGRRRGRTGGGARPAACSR